MRDALNATILDAAQYLIVGTADVASEALAGPTEGIIRIAGRPHRFGNGQVIPLEVLTGAVLDIELLELAVAGLLPKAATITAPYDVTEYSAVIVDAGVSTSSRIMVGWGACTDDDENSPATEALSFMAVAGTGQFTVTVASSNGAFGGPIKLFYSYST